MNKPHEQEGKVKGFDVLTFDGDKAGTIVGREGAYLVVAQGVIFKHHRLLPEIFATVDEAERVVRTTLSRELLDGAPELDGTVDERAVALHFGLAAGEGEPETLGYGDVAPDDPAWSAEHDGRRSGLASGDEHRVRVQQHQGAGEGPNDAAPKRLGG
jgi:hypothetical protein